MAGGDRRCFLRWLGSGAAAPLIGAAALPLAGCGDGVDRIEIRPRWAFDTGLLEGSVTLSAALDAAATIGCGVVDLRRPTDARGLLEAGVDRAKQELAQRGLRLGLVTVAEIGFAGCAPVLEAVAAVGAEGLVAGLAGKQGLSGAALKREVLASAAALKSVVQTAVRADVRLVVENVGHSLVHTAEGLHVFAQDFPKFGLAITLGRLDPRDHAYSRTIENLGPRIVRVALCGPDPTAALPGEDDRDWDEVIVALDRCAFAGRMTVGIPGRPVDLKRVEAAMNWIERRFAALS